MLKKRIVQTAIKIVKLLQKNVSFELESSGNSVRQLLEMALIHLPSDNWKM
jgi:hypothetical protein